MKRNLILRSPEGEGGQTGAPAQSAAPVMTGGPVPASITPGAPAAAPAAPAAQAPVAPAAPAAQTAPQPTGPIFMNGRRFNSMDELVAYTADLEKRQATVEAAINPSAGKQQNDNPNIHELLFEDPETAVKLIQQQTIDAIRREDAIKQNQEKSWQKFYETYPDLKGNEDFVELCRQQNWGQIEKLPLTQAMEVLAGAARNRLSQIRGNAGQGKELPSGQAMVAGSSSGSVPPVPVAQKPRSFVDQVRTMQKKK